MLSLKPSFFFTSVLHPIVSKVKWQLSPALIPCLYSNLVTAEQSQLVAEFRKTDWTLTGHFLQRHDNHDDSCSKNDLN